MAQLLAGAARAGINTVDAKVNDPLFAKVLLLKSEETTAAIVSLDSTAAFSNGFHPISGQVGIGDKYYFIEKGDERRQRDSVDAYYASVVRSDEGTPRIEFYSPEWEIEVLSWFASPLAEDIYKIYIPENDLI